MTGPTAKPPKPGIAEQAKVLSAFVEAFGKKLMSGKPHHKGVTAQLLATPPGTSRMWAKNAKLIMEDGITLLLDRLQAEVRVNDPLAPLIPEQRDGFTFNIQVGRMAMDATSIGHLMNRYAFTGARSPLYNVHVSLPEGFLILEGTLRVNRFMTLGLYLKATVAATPDGMIEMTPVEIKSGSLPVHKIMGMLGVELDRMLPDATREANPAVRFLGDRILISPTAMFPAPRASGDLVHAEVTGEHLVMSYNNGSLGIEPPLIEPEAGAYIAMLGHDLLVGKVTMKDLCLQIVPLDREATWVELSIPLYRSQLAQGESQLGYADELLYRVPAIAELKMAHRLPARQALPTPPPRA